ncbi:hypothetical protein, partial [Variovorax sp. GT1P44]|uniref:hypothetical protein n=1 Tax=Variovorax sp. GT1P44 TaxID=3443742 RepID=UPI003F453EA8
RPIRRRRWLVVYGGYAASDSSPPAIMVVVQPDKKSVAVHSSPLLPESRAQAVVVHERRGRRVRIEWFPLAIDRGPGQAFRRRRYRAEQPQRRCDGGRKNRAAARFHRAKAEPLSAA